MVKKPPGTDEKIEVRHSINPPMYLQQIRQTPYVEIRGLWYNGSLFSPTSAEQHLYSSTMEFPHSWEVLQAELMETFSAPDSADVSAQLLAQLRPTGRILDGFQLVLGGTRIQEAEVDLGSLIPAAAFNNYKLRFQFWPRTSASGGICSPPAGSTPRLTSVATSPPSTTRRAPRSTPRIS